jgi:hypothetical protein
MNTSEPAIERMWYAVAPDGAGEGLVVLRVGMPRQEPGGEWGVFVELSPVDGPPRKILGEDGWQAVALGMRFVASRAADLESGGWQFYWTQGGDPTGAKDLV